jgi:hypothetical protein
MISITVLSLEPEAVERLVAHRARDDTVCGALESLAACGLTLVAGSAALLVVLLAG